MPQVCWSVQMPWNPSEIVWPFEPLIVVTTAGFVEDLLSVVVIRFFEAVFDSLLAARCNDGNDYNPRSFFG